MNDPIDSYEQFFEATSGRVPAPEVATSTHPTRVAIEVGRYQNVEGLGAGRDGGRRTEAIRDGVGISQTAREQIDLCFLVVVEAAGYPSSGRNIRLLERRPDLGANRHYRGRHDEAAGGSRI